MAFIKKGVYTDVKNLDLSNKKFGRWTVIRLTRVKDNIGTMFFCRCDCGSEREVSWKGLRNGTSKSCGCLQKEIVGNKQRKPFGEASFNRIYRGYKRNAKMRGLSFNLTKEEFRIEINKNCFYCKKPPSSYTHTSPDNGGYTYNGIDRVDNSLGYIEGNMVTCCKQCNLMKLDYTIEEFKNHIERLYFNFVLNTPNNDKESITIFEGI